MNSFRKSKKKSNKFLIGVNEIQKDEEDEDEVVIALESSKRNKLK